MLVACLMCLAHRRTGIIAAVILWIFAMATTLSVVYTVWRMNHLDLHDERNVRRIILAMTALAGWSAFVALGAITTVPENAWPFAVPALIGIAGYVWLYIKLPMV